MHQYILKRVLVAIPTLILVSIIVFALVRVMPGDTLIAQTAMSGYSQKEDLDFMRQELGLDKPFYVQYFRWIGGYLTGDLGTSFVSRQSVTSQLARGVPISLEIAILATIIAVIMGIPIGIYSAIRQGSIGDHLGRLISITGLSLPNFWLASLFILMGVIWFSWSPAIGYISFFDDPRGNLLQFLPPSLILGYNISAAIMRITRSSMLEVIRSDYIRTAWAKGLRERQVVVRHAIKNALIPVISLIGVQAARLVGGLVVIEVVFGLPGVASYVVDGIYERDYVLVQGFTMFIAVVVIGANLLVDISYAYIDPRIRYSS